MQVGRCCVVSSAWFMRLLLLFSTLSIRTTGVGGTHQSIPPSVVKLWASAFGGEMKSISAKYSGSQLLQKPVRILFYGCNIYSYCRCCHHARYRKSVAMMIIISRNCSDSVDFKGDEPPTMKTFPPGSL
ncbi:hypothetical protein CRENBAI_023527 [Crenichthys baileyi]|uniref:Secreted protein n=1 Tax=Crenichthys baileyi TaxID=28760 RepID=A0AAV9RPN8_9TELE